MTNGTSILWSGISGAGLPGAGHPAIIRDSQSGTRSPGLAVFIIDPARTDRQTDRQTMSYPMNAGRKFDEILGVIDALQTADQKKIATSADWRPGDKFIIPGSITDEAAKDIFPRDWDEIRPYLRVTKI